MMSSLATAQTLTPGSVPSDPPRVASMQIPVEVTSWYRNPDGCGRYDTPINTTDGLVRIDQLDPAKHTILYHAADGQIRETKNYKAFKTKTVYELAILDDGTQFTPDHLIALGNDGGYGYFPAGLVTSKREKYPRGVDVWDIANYEQCWAGEGNYFANGRLVHNSCVYCSAGMTGCHNNLGSWSFMLWDTEYGKACRGGSYPSRFANDAKSRGMRLYNVTGRTYEDMRPWFEWIAKTNRFAAIGAGGSHFQTYYGRNWSEDKFYVCNNNSTSRVDSYSPDAFQRLHMASGPWVVVPDEPATAPPPQVVQWWEKN
jgi:hypothetical protein